VMFVIALEEGALRVAGDAAHVRTIAPLLYKGLRGEGQVGGLEDRR
jgi:hypothetical protein